MSALPSTGRFRVGTPPGSGTGTVSDAQILAAVLTDYSKPENYQALANNATLIQALGWLEALAGAANTRALTPGPKGDPGIGLTNRKIFALGNTYNVGDYTFHTSSQNAAVNSLWVFSGTTSYVANALPKNDADPTTGHWIELQAPAGQDGKDIALQKTTTHIQWQKTGDTSWSNLVALADIKGDNGKKLLIQKSGTYLQTQYEGDTLWTNLVALADITGANGKELELQKSGSNIQWRLAGTTTWNNLLPISDITGANGKQVTFQKTATHVQYQYVGDTTWSNLIPLVDITGPAGTIDETDYPLTLVAGTTTFVHDRGKPCKKATATVSTKIQPTAPSDGWKDNDGGFIYLIYGASGLTITLEGINLNNFPGTDGNLKNSEHWLSYTYKNGRLIWTFDQVIVGSNTPTMSYAKFDATDSVINIPNSAGNNDQSTDFTFAFKAKFGANTTTVNEVILEKGGSTGIQAILTTGGQLRMGTGNSTVNYVQTPVHNDSTWRHYALSYNKATNQIIGYIDGVEFDRKTVSAAPSITTSVINVGARTTTTKLAYGHYLAALRFWKKVSSGAQILGDKNGTRDTTNLVGEYLFEGNANDTSSLANHGTPANGVVFGNE